MELLPMAHTSGPMDDPAAPTASREWTRLQGWGAAVTGTLLVLSWLISPLRAGWDSLDRALFWAANHSLGHQTIWDGLWALSNHRLFDLVGAVCMAGIFAWSGRQQGQAGGFSLLSRALIGALVGLTAQALIHELISMKRASPALVFTDAQRLSELIPWIKSKDASKGSFPGDHGLVLLTLSFYGWGYLTRKARWAAAGAVVVFSLPRVMSGAHWPTDIFVGFVSLALIAMGLYCGLGLNRPINRHIQPLLVRLIESFCPNPLRRWLKPRGRQRI